MQGRQIRQRERGAKPQGVCSRDEALLGVQSRERAEVGCGARGVSGPEHPGPEVSGAFPRGNSKNTCVQQICILGYLAKDSVARTQGAGQEELHLSDCPQGL